MRHCKSALAINGGSPVRSQPFPYRALFGDTEFQQVREVFDHARETGQDFGYQGPFEERYTEAFSRYQGGGLTDAVCSGTAAVYVALRALELPPDSEIIVSPVTDPGSIAAAVLQGFRLIICDSAQDSFNVGVSEFQDAVGTKTRAAILTHAGGVPFEAETIAQVARTNGIKLIEDCSQAHGGERRGTKVGCFGELAVFSTMFSKNHATGGCGGLVYTEDRSLYWKVRAHADRGKQPTIAGFDPKDPACFLGPALNLNQDEISCAIGLAGLDRLEATIEKRRNIVDRINSGLKTARSLRGICAPLNSRPSYFFHTIQVDLARLTVDKVTFAQAVAAEGIGVNPDYRYVLSEWPWLDPFLLDRSRSQNAKAFRNCSFNLLFNERYSSDDVDDVIEALLKVDDALAI